MGADGGEETEGQQQGTADQAKSQASVEPHRPQPDRGLMSLEARYKDEPDTLRAANFQYMLRRALAGRTKENPFPRHEDKGGIKEIVRFQKDLIRTIIRITEGGHTGDDQIRLNDFYDFIACLDQAAAKKVNMDPKAFEIFIEARSRWNGVKAEAAIINSLLYADFDVHIPTEEEVIDMDFLGGVDLLACKDDRVFAIDAKSGKGDAGGYGVSGAGDLDIHDAVKKISRAHFGDMPITQAIVTVDPSALRRLAEETDPSKQLRNLKDYLTLPEAVEASILAGLDGLQSRKSV